MTQQPQRWHAGRILFALARYFDWQKNYLMPEYEIGGRADLVVITPALYLTEIEIKISVADWKNDQHKLKWRVAGVKSDWERNYIQKRRDLVSRFFYAIPETLENKIPALLPEGVGILVVRSGGRYGYDEVTPLREAVRRKSRKLPPEEFNAIMRTCYFRYWSAQFDIRRMVRDREQMNEIRRAHA